MKQKVNQQYLYYSERNYDSIMINALRQRQNGHHFADDICQCIFVNENVWISIEIPLKFVP